MQQWALARPSSDQLDNKVLDVLTSYFYFPIYDYRTDSLAGSVYIVVYTSVMLEMQGWEFVSLLFSASFLLISLIFPRRHLVLLPTSPHLPQSTQYLTEVSPES